jgi:hypothetical protein
MNVEIVKPFSMKWSGMPLIRSTRARGRCRGRRFMIQRAREFAIPGLTPPRKSRRVVSEALVTAVTSLDGATLQRCFPRLAAFLDNYQNLERQRQEQAEAKRAADAAAAQRQEAERRKQWEARRAADAAAEQRFEAERRKPANRVTEGYALYRLVRHCNEVRRGYMVQFVNDDEFKRATATIQAIVKKAKKDEPNISTDNLWNESAAGANRRPIGANLCQAYLRDLLQMSPVAVYEEAKPPE